MIIRRDSEQGAALIIAMMILLVLSLVTAAMALWAGTLLSRSQLQSRSGIGFLQLESASAHALWLLINDFRLHPERVALDEIVYDQDERFVADNQPHYFQLPETEYYFEVRILDYLSGLNVNDGNFLTTLEELERKGEDYEVLRRKAELKERLLDYIDSDKSRRTSGMETEEYLAIGQINLPRNDVPVYPEELMVVPGAFELFPVDEFGRQNWFMSSKVQEGKPNLFSAPRELIYQLAEADENGRKYIEEAFEDIYERRRSFGFSLGMVDAGLWSRIQENFSLEESGYFVILVRPMVESRYRGRSLELVVKFDIDENRNIDTGSFELISQRFL